MIIKTQDFVTNVCGKMTDVLNIEEMERLRGVLFLSLKNRRVQKEDTEIAIYEAKDNEWYINRFLMTKKVNGLTERTLKSYCERLERVFSVIGKPVTSISSEDIIAYLAKRNADGKLSRDTVRGEYLALSTFYAWFVGEEYIGKNPMNKVPSIKRCKTKKEAFSEMEIERLRSACINARESCLIEVLLSTGCRISELIHLKVEDVLGKDECVILGKGMKERTVYFNARTQLVVQKYIKERRDSNQYLFPMRAEFKAVIKAMGKPLNKDWYKNKKAIAPDGSSTADAIRHMLNDIGQRAGLPKGSVYPHKFRRTCATLALRRGMPLEQVGRMLGHEDLATTQIYLDLNDDELKQAHRKYVV